MNKLQQLKKKSIIVADSGEIDEIKKYKPQDATTNPTLILNALKKPQYKIFLQEVVKNLEKLNLSKQETVQLGCDHLAVTIGCEILRFIDGKISTEVDPRLSFDIKRTVERSKRLISYYETLKIPRERVLIKIASTWEGIKAAEILRSESINCNMTLLFDISQAMAVANSKIFLISPFVGRILDWYNKNEPKEYTIDNDPGVLNVKTIYHYFKDNEIDTILMGASFRSQQQIEALAGCDRLTISPNFLESLTNDEQELKLSITDKKEELNIPEYKNLTREEFKWQLNQSAMATEKLSEGIRNFANNQNTLESMLHKMIEK